MVRIRFCEGAAKIADVGLLEKKFATRWVGYWVSRKLELNGSDTNVTSSLVKIGSRPKKDLARTPPEASLPYSDLSNRLS